MTNLLAVPDDGQSQSSDKSQKSDRTITIDHPSDVSEVSSMQTSSEEFDTGAGKLTPKEGPPLPWTIRANADLITPDKVSEILSELPFFKILTPVFRNYIAE